MVVECTTLRRYIDGSDLFELMSKQPDAFTDAVIRHFSASILSVLHFLHAPPDVMIFRDIKPENIMVTHEGYVKLIDFGIARRLASESSNADSQVCVWNPAREHVTFLRLQLWM